MGMHARRFTIVMAMWMLLAGTSSAAPDAALKHKAQELLTEGNALVLEGDFGAALVKFRTAHELYPSPKLLLNIGTSLRQMGRNAEAAATYEQYLAHPDADPARADELRGILVELDKLVGRLDIRVGETGVRVSLDGARLRDLQGHTVARVDPGRHTLVAEKEGRAPTVRHVAVAAGETASVVLVLNEPGQEPTTPVNLQRLAGWGLAALGGASAVAGGVLGVFAQLERGKADNHCATEGAYAGYCSQEGTDLNDEARVLGATATALFVGGFGVAVGGLALVFTAADEDEMGARLELGPGAGARAVVQW